MKLSATLLDAFEAHVASQPAKDAFVFLGNGTDETDRLSYAALRARALGVADKLRHSGIGHEPVLLAYPPGLDFIVALLACFYAGAIAVPVPYLTARRARERMVHIARDCQPRAVVSDADVVDMLGGEAAAGAIRIGTDRNDASASLEASPSADATDIALIQYSSGSTSTPKGAVISHANLAHNQRMMAEVFGHDAGSVGVNWVPMYHDMGLIGAVLQTLYCGSTSIMLPPLKVLQKPILWLEAISRYRGNTSTAPTFAYEMCLRSIPPQQRSRLDLRSWQVAICGGEPVRADVLEQFAAGFAVAGFAANAFVPAYGLAEATLLVASPPRNDSPRICSVDVDSLGRGIVAPASTGRSRRLVSCGVAHLGQRVVIADPETLRLLPPGRVGEIWLAGDSVARGYWRQPAATRESFHARLADGEEYLRTGDLGFISEQGIFVTGRLKELLIVRGCKYYPQDIEDTVRTSHPAFAMGHGAAFGVENEGQEKAIVAFEPSRDGAERLDLAAAAAAAIAAVSRDLGLQLYDFVPVRSGALPRTTSGKIQRNRCRELYLAAALPRLSEKSPLTGLARRRSAASGTGSEARSTQK